jgi:hypothetical protein
VIPKIERILFSFLWASNEKIKRKTLVKPVLDGGIDMVDIQAFFKSLKSSWIARLLCSENNWSFYGKNLLIGYGIDVCWAGINTDLKHIKELCDIPIFYKQAIEGLISGNNIIFPNNTFEFLNSYLWGNSIFHSKDAQPFYFLNWIKKGIIKIKDLPFVNGQINETELYNKIGYKQNILSEIFQIKNMLAYFKEFTNSNSIEPNPTDTGVNNNDLPKKSKVIYKNIIQKQMIHSTNVAYWEKRCQTKNIPFRNIYNTRVKLIEDKIIADFSFRVLHNIIPCKENLFKWRIEPSNLCNLCGVIEDTPHMLLECIKVRHIWKAITTKLQINSDIYSIFLGFENPSMQWAILIIQFLIYKYCMGGNTKNMFANIKFYIKYSILHYTEIYEKYDVVSKYLKDIAQVI